MAEKVIAISMQLDTSNAVSGLNEVDAGLKKVDASVEGLEQDAKKLTLGEQIQKINAEVQSGEVGFRGLRKKIQEYQTIAIAAGRTSPVGKEALQQAAVLRDQLDDLDKEVKNLATDGQALQGALQLGQGVVAGFTAFKGVTAALGIENENLMKVMTQLQGLQAAMMGLERLHTLLRKETILAKTLEATKTKALAAAQVVYNTVVGASTGALKVFKIALASTGIGLLIVGLALLVTNFESVIEVINKAVEAFKSFSKAINSEEIAMQKLREMNAKEMEKIHEKRMGEIEEERDGKIEAIDDTIKAYQLEKDTLEANGEASTEVTMKILEAEKEKLRVILEANTKKIQSYVDYYTNLAALRGEDEESFKQSMANQGIDLEMLQAKADKLLQENQDNIQYAENKITAFKRQQEEKRATNSKKVIKEVVDAQAQANLDYLALEEELTQLLIGNMEEGAEKELAILADKQDKERDMLIANHGKNSELEAALDEKHEQELLKLHDKFDKQRIAKQEELIDLQLSNLEDGANKEIAILKEKQRREMEAITGNSEMDTEMKKELKIQQEGALNELQAELDEQAKEERQAKVQEGLDMAQNFLDAASQINDMLNEIGDRKIERLEADRDKSLGILGKQKKAELAQEGLTANQKIAIENKYAKAEYDTKVKSAKAADKIAEKQFKREKALKIAQIAINTAGSVMQALGSMPPPISFVFAGVNAAMGIAQGAIVASQKFKSSAANIAPPSFTAPNISAGGEASSGTGAGGGEGQTDVGTDLSNLPDETNVPVIVSQVDINNTQNTMANIEEVSTLG